jgi:hypothetical protein
MTTGTRRVPALVSTFGNLEASDFGKFEIKKNDLGANGFWPAWADLSVRLSTTRSVQPK